MSADDWRSRFTCSSCLFTTCVQKILKSRTHLSLPKINPALDDGLPEWNPARLLLLFLQKSVMMGKKLQLNQTPSVQRCNPRNSIKKIRLMTWSRLKDPINLLLLHTGENCGTDAIFPEITAIKWVQLIQEVRQNESQRKNDFSTKKCLD